MKIDFVRLKAPVCFLIMTLAALAVIVIMSKGEVEATESEITHNVQSVAEEEEMSSTTEQELFFF